MLKWNIGSREAEHSDLVVKRVNVTMECNKNEAIRAKKIAENQMRNNDFEGAKKTALKVRKLFPDLDSISQILAVCEVHCTAQKTINGAQMDFYGILQVDSLADEATITKQYQNLALVLHPDKNKFPGAKAAFELIGEANTILSDKWKRYLHDFKCNDFATPETQNHHGNHNGAEAQEEVTRPPCKRARGSCGEVFSPGKILHVSNSRVTNSKIEEKDKFKSNSDSKDEMENPEFANFDKEKEKDCFEVGQIWACYDPIDVMPRFYAQIRKVYKIGFRVRITWLEGDPESQPEIRWAEEGLPVSCGKFVRGETEEIWDPVMFSHRITFSNGKKRSSYMIYPKQGEIWALFKDWDISWSSDPKAPMEYKFEIVEVLSDFENDSGVLVANMVKVKGFVGLFQKISPTQLVGRKIPPSELFRFSHRVPAVKMTGTERADVPVGSFELDTASLPDDLNEFYVSNESPKTPELQLIHDFESERKNWKFQEGDIWAIRKPEDQNGICYAQIKKIESSPLRLHVDLLELCISNDMLRPNACGLYKASTCGRQRFLQDSFLYIVKAEVNGKNRFNIYPNEKEIWILYSKQDSKSTFSDVECEVVEVVENIGDMIKVLCLSRVAGYKSVFRASEIEKSKSGVL